jgi:flagellar assembly protein FliH
MTFDGAREFELPALEVPEGFVERYAAPAPTAPQIDLVAEAEAARAAGHEAGFQAGLVEGRAMLTPAIEALREAVAGVAAERERVAAAVEHAAVELGLRIAEQAMAAAVETDAERVVDVVRGALRRLVERDRVTVLVHPDDMELVREATAGLVSELGGIEHCDVQAERRVARGGAIVRTVEGEVDATLQTKLERAAEVLREELGRGAAAAAPEPLPAVVAPIAAFADAPAAAAAAFPDVPAPVAQPAPAPFDASAPDLGIGA